jgi:sugar lactone lactonase YvrE
MFNEGSSELILTLHNAHSTSLCFDSISNNIYIGDLATCSVYFKSLINHDNTIIENILVNEFEDQPLKGPTSLSYNSEENILYLTDAGGFMDSNLYENKGSLYIVDLESKIMRKICSSLSYPADVVYDHARRYVYIAETYANRVIRLAQNPDGVYHSTVFYQFNGRFGPSALTVDEYGNLYIARYEFQDLDSELDGLISVLNYHGVLIGEMYLPKLVEITGMFISPKKKDSLYITERNSNGVMKVKLSSFLFEIDKIKSEEIKFN